MVVSLSANVRNRRRGRGNQTVQERQLATQLRWSSGRRWTAAGRYRARPEQLPPTGSWRVWLLVAGRGFGKTRCGAEWVRAEVKAGRRRIALVRPTAADAGWYQRLIMRASESPNYSDLRLRRERNRWFADSPLEEVVRSELVSETQFPC